MYNNYFNCSVLTAYFLNGGNQECLENNLHIFKDYYYQDNNHILGANCPFYIKSQSSFSKTCVDQLTCFWSCSNFNTSCYCYIYWIKAWVKFRGCISEMVFKVSLVNTFKFERQSLLRLFLFLVSHLPLSLLARSAAKVNSPVC